MKKQWVFFLGIILIFWIPAFLAMFPGNYSYDATMQLSQIMVTHKLSAHHPPLHTFFLYSCVNLGIKLFGTARAGMIIHSVIQGFIMASIFSYACVKVGVYTQRKWTQFLSILFFSINPIIQVMIFSTTKDVLFGGLLLLFLIHTIDLLADCNYFLKSIHKKLIYIVTAVLMCLFRNQGIYVFIFGAIVIGFTAKKIRKQWILLSAVSVSLLIFITDPVYSIIGIEKGNAREMLSVPMQQIARVMKISPQILSEKELNLIYELIPKEYLEQYQPEISDFVKSGFQTNVLKENLLDYVKLWIEIGVRCPKIYLDSFFWESIGYWSISATCNHGRAAMMYDGAFEQIWQIYYENGLISEQEYHAMVLKRTTYAPRYDEYLREVSYKFIQDQIPVIRIILSMAFPFWSLIVTAVFSIYQKKAEGLALFFVFGYWSTLLLGPVVMVRYAFPLILCCPIMFSIILKHN